LRWRSELGVAPAFLLLFAGGYSFFVSGNNSLAVASFVSHWLARRQGLSISGEHERRPPPQPLARACHHAARALPRDHPSAPPRPALLHLTGLSSLLSF